MTLTADARHVIRWARDRAVRERLQLDRVDSMGRGVGFGAGYVAFGDVCFEEAHGDPELALAIGLDIFTAYGGRRGPTRKHPHRSDVVNVT